MSENPRRGRQARNFTTNVPKILDLKSSSEQIFFRKLPLGAPDFSPQEVYKAEQVKNLNFDSSVKELKVSVAIFFSHKCIKYFSYKFFF